MASARRDTHVLASQSRHLIVVEALVGPRQAIEVLYQGPWGVAVNCPVPFFNPDIGYVSEPPTFGERGYQLGNRKIALANTEHIDPCLRDTFFGAACGMKATVQEVNLGALFFY